MKYRVTISFDLDPVDYGVNPHNKQHVKSLVKAMLDSETDWPWKCEKVPGDPTIILVVTNN